MTSPPRAKLNDLFNFQGLRKRALIASDYSVNDERFALPEEVKPIENEYDQLDLTGEQFESYVRPASDQADWIAERKHIRNEVNRLGDLLDFYDHKPNLNDLEKRVYKRLSRRDQSMQTDPEPEKPSMKIGYGNRLPVIRLPPPLAMERVEEFLAENHWRLLDLFRTLDRNKSWGLVKEDFKRMIEKEKLNISDAQAEELITCFCREVHVPLDYKKFARGRTMYRKTLRDNASKTPSSMDTQLESDMSNSTPSSSNYLQLPSTDISHNYPRRDATSSHSRSTISSMAKIKRASVSTFRTDDSKLSYYQ